MINFGKEKINPTTEHTREYENYFFKDIEESSEIIVRQLKERIENNTYGLIIADDAGGRIPGLILGKIFKAVQQDTSLVKTLFIAGGNLNHWDDYSDETNGDASSVKENEIAAYVKKNAADSPKALFVTESVGEGGGTSHFVTSLEKVGLDFDIVLFEALHTPETYKERHEQFGRHEIFMGKEVDLYEDGWKLYGLTSQFAGVEKEGREITSHREHPSKENIKSVQSARRDIDILVERVVKKVWPELIKK